MRIKNIKKKLRDTPKLFHDPKETVLERVPIPWTVTLTVSFGFRKRFGVRLPPVPSGDPVAITSPGRKVNRDEAYAICRGRVKIISCPKADCMTSPLSVTVRCKSAIGGSASAVVIQGGRATLKCDSY